MFLERGKKKTSREIKPHPPNSGRQYKCLRLSGGLCLSRWPPQLQQLSPLSLSNFTENSHHLNSDTDLCIYSHIDTFKLSGKSLKQPQKETEGNNPDTAQFHGVSGGCGSLGHSHGSLDLSFLNHKELKLFKNQKTNTI